MRAWRATMLGGWALLMAATGAVAEEMPSVQGRVLEAESRQAVAGATITIRELPALKVLSGKDGGFSIKLPEAGRYTLNVSASGYDSPNAQEIDARSGVSQPGLVISLRASPTLKEVVVSSERTPDQVSKTVVTGEEAKHAPGTQGDPLRAIQSLPGVVTTNDTSAEIAVRGSGPTDNAYYADSLPIGYLFHFDGSSVFNPDLIADFNLYSAAFPPHYFDVTGAVLDVGLREPRADRLHGKARVSMLGAGLMLEGPVTGNQSFYFAGRRSYFDFLLGKITQKGITFKFPSYGDFQGRYLWRINDDHKLSLYVNGAQDAFHLSVAANSDLGLSQPGLAGAGNIITDYSAKQLVLDSVLSSNSVNKLVVGRLNYGNSVGMGTAISTNVNGMNNVVLEQYNVQLAEKHDVTLSGDYYMFATDVNLDVPQALCTQFTPNCDLTTAPRVKVNQTITGKYWATSARDRWAATQHLTLIGGVRNTHNGYLKRTYTDPRLGAEYAWSERTMLTAGWGRHNQQPEGAQMIAVFGNPGLSHIRAEHYTAGVGRKLDDGWSWKMEGYYKKLSDLVVDDPLLHYINAGSGKAYGVELLMKKAMVESWSGWVSVTLSRSRRHNNLTGQDFSYMFDQPVNVVWVSNYKLSDGWTLGTKWVYHTGNSYTPVIGTNGFYPDGRVRPLYGSVNSARMPGYHRLDLRLDKSYNYTGWKLNTFFEIINAYARKNVSGYNYGPNYDKKEPIYQLPFMPSFGVEAEF